MNPVQWFLGDSSITARKHDCLETAQKAFADSSTIVRNVFSESFAASGHSSGNPSMNPSNLSGYSPSEFRRLSGSPTSRFLGFPASRRFPKAYFLSFFPQSVHFSLRKNCSCPQRALGHVTRSPVPHESQRSPTKVCPLQVGHITYRGRPQPAQASCPFSMERRQLGQ